MAEAGIEPYLDSPENLGAVVARGTKCGTTPQDSASIPADLAGLVEALAALTPEQRSALIDLAKGMGAAASR